MSTSKHANLLKSYFAICQYSKQQDLGSIGPGLFHHVSVGLEIHKNWHFVMYILSSSSVAGSCWRYVRIVGPFKQQQSDAFPIWHSASQHCQSCTAFTELHVPQQIADF